MKMTGVPAVLNRRTLMFKRSVMIILLVSIFLDFLNSSPTPLLKEREANDSTRIFELLRSVVWLSFPSTREKGQGSVQSLLFLISI